MRLKYLNIKLKPNQIENLEWMKKDRKIPRQGLIADECGLGKTITLLALIASLWEEEENAEKKLSQWLICLPNYVVMMQWIDEIIKYFIPPDSFKGKKWCHLFYSDTGYQNNRNSPEQQCNFFNASLVLTTLDTLSQDIGRHINPILPLGMNVYVRGEKKEKQQVICAKERIKGRYQYQLTGNSSLFYYNQLIKVGKKREYEEIVLKPNEIDNASILFQKSFHGFFLDESHNCKSNGIRSKRVYDFRQNGLEDNPWCFLMTGTPHINSAEDIVKQASIIHGLDEIRNIRGDKCQQWVKKWWKVGVIHHKAIEFDCKKKIERVEIISSKKESTEYRNIRENALFYFNIIQNSDLDSKTYINARGMILKQIQQLQIGLLDYTLLYQTNCCCCLGLVNEETNFLYCDSHTICESCWIKNKKICPGCIISMGMSKAQKIIDIIQQFWTKHPKDGIIVASTYEKYIRLLSKILKIKGIPCKQFTGRVKRKERSDIISKFNHEKGFVLLLTYKSGSEGLNLQEGCGCIVHCDPWFHKELHSQTNARALRFNQIRKYVLIYELSAFLDSGTHTVEQWKYALQQKKDSENIKNSSKKNKSMSYQDLRILFKNAVYHDE